jgi:RHS repeat-associated protein
MSSYSNTACPIVTFAYDRLGRVLSAVTAVSSNFFEYAGLDLVGEVQNGAAITRTYDGFGRPAGFNLGSAYTAAYGYDTFGRFASVSSSVASVFSVANYSYVTGSGLVASMTNSAGFWWRRAYEQNRDLIADVENGFGGDTVSDFAYVNDADGRRERRVDSGSATNLFASNGRGEVTEAVMGTGTYAYGYDDIGNRVFSVLNTVTNTYAANNLNQYTAITGAAPSYPTYDADGNLKRSGDWHHAWDAENRLVRSEPYGIATNGAVMLEYGYNHRSLCVTKITKQLSGRGAGYPMDPSQPGSWDAVKTHTFVYDGWNLALETIAHTNGTVDRIEYVWGLDLSGTLQGAGGVGGLLFEKRNGQIYIPLYDANGNVTDYVDAYGTVRGHFEYDAFGNTVAMWGDLVHSFKFRFSTKYWDDETRSYYYGYRHYAPKLGCWLSRDPIEEMGGVGLYGFVGNNAIVFVDALGQNKFCAKCCPNKCRIGEIQLDQMTIFITATGKPSIDAAGSINLLEQSLVLTKAAVITFLQGPGQRKCFVCKFVRRVMPAYLPC